MNKEIERKFIVKDDRYKQQAAANSRIAQGYLSSHPGRTVRIRIKKDKGYITIKGSTSSSGLSRYEWEKEIPAGEAEELLQLCEPGIIDKIRYEVPFEGRMFEVDEFLGANKGLVIAEIELAAEDEQFAIPEWIGREVTGISRYYNSQLAKAPYSIWK